MGSSSTYSFNFPLIIFFIIYVQLMSNVHCMELDVGGDKGWVTPSAKDGDQFFNDWASNNRFKVNDTLRFKYKKDSVMAVSHEEYEKCRSSHPMFFSNNGDTVFTVDHPGLYYFISGVAGHCERGLNMIIKVLEPESPPQLVSNQTSSVPPPPPPPSSDARLLQFNVGFGPHSVFPVSAMFMLIVSSFFNMPWLF